MSARRRTPEQEAARKQRRADEIAARASMSPTGPAEDRLRVATWNINSLRARLPAVERFLDRVRPDVLCLQETKAPARSADAERAFADRGYVVVEVGRGGYNGVALASRHPLVGVAASGDLGIDALDREPRLITAVVDARPGFRVTSVYVPHGREVGGDHYRFKLEFLDALTDRCRTWAAEAPQLVAGDLNVAATDHDVFHPDAFVGSTHVSPAERAALARLLDAGLVDVDVTRWGAKARRFTWWNYGIGYSRNLGMRIDAIAASPSLVERLDTTWIDHLEREGERPSDHAALVADFTIA